MSWTLYTKPGADSAFVAREAFQGIRSSEFPGAAGLPTVNAALGTVTLSAAGAGSSIASAQDIRPSRDVFRPMAAEPILGTSYPDYLGWKNYWASTSVGGWAVEFDLDSVSGVFEVRTKGDGQKIAVMVDGQYLNTTGTTITAGGSLYNLIVTLASGGMKRVRVEFDGNGKFFGVYVGPTDGVYAAPRRPVRAVWVGDSFAEPTISDSGGSHHGQGVVPMFGWATGWEVIPAGRGGTGFVTTGSYVKYADRLAELLAVPNLDVVILQMSANDNAATTAAVLAEVQACVALAQASGFTKFGQIIIAASWWNRYPDSMPAGLIDKDIAVRQWCDSQGIPFIDTLIPQVSGAVSTTISTAISATQTNLVVVDRIPSLAAAPGGNAAGGQWFVQIGNPGSSTLEVRQVNSYSGTGPFTLSLANGVSNAHSVGEAVVQVGKGLLTGNGYQGATTGSGTSDRFTGTDGTHSTVAGARWRGLAYAARLQAQLPH